MSVGIEVATEVKDDMAAAPEGDAESTVEPSYAAGSVDHNREPVASIETAFRGSASLVGFARHLDMRRSNEPHG